jgi:hypothetical protein
MKRQRNKRLEAARLILQRAQLEQVIDAVFVVFDVAVEHGRVRLQPDLVRQARRVEPFIAVNLVIADDVPHAVGKNFGAAAGQRIDARLFHLSSVSRIVSFDRFARYATSTMVKAFMWTCGKRSFNPETRSRKYWNGKSGCSPPTM